MAGTSLGRLRDGGVNLIRSVTTKGGQAIRSAFEEGAYKADRKVAKEQRKALRIEQDECYFEWKC